jgi:hypothetical protein
MGDPLIELYDKSFLRKWPGRLAKEPLPRFLLEQLSTQIQRTGQPLGEPPELLRLRIPNEKLPVPDNWVVPPLPPTTATDQFRDRKIDWINQTNKLRPQLWKEQNKEYELLFAFYEELVKQEYDRVSKFKAPKDELFKFFEGYGKKRGLGGLGYYKSLRPIWYRANIREPVEFMDKVLIFSGVTLAGVEVKQGVHPEFADMLKLVDGRIAQVTKRLKATSAIANPSMKAIQYIGCFRPEPLGDKISNHMIGAAIDIDSQRNPHLFPPQVRALDQMLELIEEQAKEDAANNPLVQPLETLRIAGSWLGALPKLQTPDDVEKARIYYNKTVKISERTKTFLNDFFDAWKEHERLKTPPTEPKLVKAYPIVTALVKAFEGAGKLATVQKLGLISIPAEVFITLHSDANIQWGNYAFYRSKDPDKGPHVDTMHFEVKNTDAVVGSGYP